ncbi:MAG: polyprenyl synthetase family protein [Woeseiaceae bacterium]
MADNLSIRSGAEVTADGSFANRVAGYRDRINSELARCLMIEDIANDTLAEAMKYALLGSGKRMRPLLAYASSELLQIDMRKADAIAAAIEMIHAYSLVHDDLPAMDDDDLRRGRPTVHVAFDEAMAILVGDALQASAFRVLSGHESVEDNPAVGIALVRHLANAAGAAGMVGGQALDIEYSGTDVQRDQLEDMFARKTGRLIEASITMPLLCADEVTETTSNALRQFSRNAGLCFQIHDDILDATGTAEQIGKPAGSDVEQNRAAYPIRFGLAAAQARARLCYEEAMDCIDRLGPGAEGLGWLCNYIVNRNH